MRESAREAIRNTLEDLIISGARTSFTEKELKELGIEIPDVKISAKEIREIRFKVNLSQSVFAKLLNVSLSSVRQWEQGKRTPTGPTKVLLELLKKDPGILYYRIESASHQ